MKNSQITVIELVKPEDVQTYRDATGLVLEVGNFVVQGILNDTPEGIRVFPNAEKAMEYISEKVFASTLKGAVLKGPKKATGIKAAKIAKKKNK